MDGSCGCGRNSTALQVQGYTVGICSMQNSTAAGHPLSVQILFVSERGAGQRTMDNGNLHRSPEEWSVGMCGSNSRTELSKSDARRQPRPIRTGATYTPRDTEHNSRTFDKRVCHRA